MLYALIASDCAFAVELFAQLADAESAMADAIADEPEWIELLSVVALETPDITWGRFN